MGISTRMTSAGVVVTDVPGWPGWSFTVGYRATTAGRPVLTSVKATAPEEMTAGAARNVPYGTVFRAARALVDPGNPLVALVAASVDAPARRPRGGSPEFDRAVVRLYRMAIDQGVPPRAVIAERFGVDKKTVGGWLAHLRRAGAIGTYADEVRGRSPSPRMPHLRRSPSSSGSDGTS